MASGNHASIGTGLKARLGKLIGLRSLPRIRLHGWRGVSFDYGRGNRFDVKGRLIGVVRIGGDGNLIEIGQGATLSGSVNLSGSECTITIAEEAIARGQFTVRGRGLTFSVGRKSTMVKVYLVCQERCGVSIGEQCMISRDVEIRTSDAHALIDVATGRRINMPRSVTIGDHVWIGARCMISKGAAIPHDSVVGAMSFVNKAFHEPNVVIAGVPARVVRTGVTWDRSSRPSYPRSQLFRLRDRHGDEAPANGGEARQGG